jgi:hypothetical protein
MNMLFWDFGQAQLSGDVKYLLFIFRIIIKFIINLLILGRNW